MSEPAPSEQPPSPQPPQTGFRLPADYYASPPTEVRPLFPRSVRIGCGSAAAVLLLVVFVGGALMARGGMGKIMDLVLGMMQNEIAPMYAKDVTPAQRQDLDRELTLLRQNLRAGRVPVSDLNPVMMSLRDAVGDDVLTPPEVDRLVSEIRKTNEGKKKGK